MSVDLSDERIAGVLEEAAIRLIEHSVKDEQRLGTPDAVADLIANRLRGVAAALRARAVAQSGTTHWPRCATDGGPRHYECARVEIKRLGDACIKMDHEVQQTLGKALGYPWFKDDLINFPGAVEADGVCVGEHVAESIAMEAARRIRESVPRASVERLSKRAEHAPVCLAWREDGCDCGLDAAKKECGVDDDN